jgi:hypothetical protein
MYLELQMKTIESETGRGTKQKVLSCLTEKKKAHKIFLICES